MHIPVRARPRFKKCHRSQRYRSNTPSPDTSHGRDVRIALLSLVLLKTRVSKDVLKIKQFFNFHTSQKVNVFCNVIFYLIVRAKYIFSSSDGDLEVSAVKILAILHFEGFSVKARVG